MSRWEPNARDRLARSALSLYSIHGFEQTTVADIAKEAGLTERTFFRYFSDKREVLFWGAGFLQEFLVSSVINAPQSTAPIAAIASALEAASAEFFEDRRADSRQRQTIISASVELQERELTKLSTLAGALAGALRERGVSGPGASLAAEAGIAVFRVAFERWIEETNEKGLADILQESFRELRDVAAGRSPRG